MPQAAPPDDWRRLVLRSLPLPAWLGVDAPAGDVVLSSRARAMRNLRGLRFPNVADDPELKEVRRRVLAAVERAGLDLEEMAGIGPAEREYLVGCRLLSPEFPWAAPHRTVLLDRDRRVSVMVNEEDHLRLQALTAGLSVQTASATLDRLLSCLEPHLEFAATERFGYLAASPLNAGRGRRQSAMFHLIGLAHRRRLPKALEALADQGFAARGLFGESSRAVGAFLQVSTTTGDATAFAGACAYLVEEERTARQAVGLDEIAEKGETVRQFAIGSRAISLADALRTLAWVRLSHVSGLPGFSFAPRQLDAALTTLETHVGSQPDSQARRRADFLRSVLEPPAVH